MIQILNKTPNLRSWSRYRAGMFLIGSVFMLFTLPASAEYHSAKALRQTVADFLEQQTTHRPARDTEITVGNIDRRLKLTACQNPPQAFLAAGAKLQGKLTVGLRCLGPKPWTVYMPAQIKLFSNVVVAAQPLLRGHNISKNDVLMVRQEVSHLNSGYFIKSEAVVGKILTQTLAAGHVITPKRVKAPILVHRGEKVAIIASVGTLEVRGKGEALRDAARGELVNVRSSRSKRIVQGIVTKAGTVKVQM